jgi:predicted outer membrane protein
MSRVYGHRPAARRRTRGHKWPWWLLFGAIAATVLAVSVMRGVYGAGNANTAGGTYTPVGAPAATTTHDHDTVQVAAAATAEPTWTGPLPSGWTMTSFGPLGPADRELLVRVRQAGLWEAPAGQLAQTHSNNARVKEVGAQLATDHHGLDVQVRQVAAQLGVTLPDKPTAEQQGWITELTGKTGADFDTAFANLLRAAHGKVFAVVGSVRSGTRNSLVRSFAQTGVNVVMKHMTLLESIGNVNFAALPTPVGLPSNTAAKPASNTSSGSLNAVWFIAGLALIGCIAVATRVVRGSRASRHRSPAF